MTDGSTPQTSTERTPATNGAGGTALEASKPFNPQVAEQVAEYTTGGALLAGGFTLLYGALTGLYHVDSTVRFVSTVVIATLLIVAGTAVNLYSYKRRWDDAIKTKEHLWAMERFYAEKGEKAGGAAAAVPVPTGP